MSVLERSFDACIARPDDGDRTYPLRDHLNGVRRFMEQWTRSHPAMQNDEIWIRLIGLAGCCHDIAKANWDWQHYIRHTDKLQSPMHHAPAGASLFSYLGYHLLDRHGVWLEHFRHWYWLTRDIADHHGSLKALDHEGWRKVADWDRMDLAGVAAYLHQQFDELRQVPITQSVMEAWACEVDDVIGRTEMILRRVSRRSAQPTHQDAMGDLHLWRYMTTGLIAADRFDISPTVSGRLNDSLIARAECQIEQFCSRQSGHPLASERMEAQRSILRQLEDNSNQRIFTLSMPTGYGKTVTALKIALWMAEYKGCGKLIYVAPYIAILEQTSDVIAQAMQLRALEHHSLAIWDEKEYNSRTSAEDKHEQRISGSQLVVESWAHEAVCTSFQQLGRAVFPKRAQDVLRRSFLQDSVLLIDEPQIFRPEGWNTFLCGLESLAESYNLRIVFLSATMPPFRYGLTHEPVALSYTAKSEIGRYRVERLAESLCENRLADFLMGRQETVQGAILNTIEDAYLVREAVMRREPAADVLLVHGLMIPLHKKAVISRIQHHLLLHRDQPLIVVSTQVLEAGIDVSFEHLARALPILPSIVQAAGRVNRHAEMTQQGILTVFPFLRRGTGNTRKSIYDPALMDITDNLLQKQSIWTESEISNLIQEYYQLMFRHNNYTTGMDAIMKAYRGQWPELSQFEPFGADLYRLPLFVPWRYSEEDTPFLPETFTTLCNKFGMNDPATIYARYKDKAYWQKRDFSERKTFMVLFQYYLLNIPVKLALKLVGEDDYLLNKIPYFEMGTYDRETGLTRHFDSDYDAII